MNIEMLSTGDEVLYGQITDTNAAWLADTFFAHGLVMTHRSTVGDQLAPLVAELQQRSQHADILIVNGGLGPTSDDLSALAAATACGVGLELNQQWLQRMEAFFSDRGRLMAASNRKQAEIPQYAEMIDNRVGTACGFAVTLNDCRIFFTPGVPSEFKVMVTEQILPRLAEQFSLPEAPVCLRLTTFGRGESDLAVELDALSLPEGVTLGYRAAMPVVEIKLTGPAEQRIAMENSWQQIRQQLADWILFEGTEGLPAVLAREILQRGLSLAVSEQFTAGLLYWSLAGADVALKGGDLSAAGEESLSALADRTRRLAKQQQASLALSVSALTGQSLGICLVTPEGIQANQLRFTTQRHSRAARQELITILAMNMLLRWLQGKNSPASHSWLDVTEHLTLPVNGK